MNLVDTSTNYTDGGSERLIGQVVGEAIRRGRLAREGIVVVSKIGYVQGQNLALAQEREAAAARFPRWCTTSRIAGTACTPRSSRTSWPGRLTGWASGPSTSVFSTTPSTSCPTLPMLAALTLDATRDEFYRRLTEAFRFFEARVAEGALGWYGVSSNTVAHPVDDPEATSLARMLAAAEAAGGPGHHFGVLQLPMNFFEPGGILESNNPPDAPATARRSVLELASTKGIGVLVNRPLNAVVGRGMVRLADFP